MQPEMRGARAVRPGVTRRSMQQAGANFDELMRLALENDSVIVTLDGQDRLIVLSVDRFEKALEQLIILGPHDRGG